MKKQIQTKISYYIKQENNFITKYLDTNNRRDKESLLKIRERLKVYNEVLELVNDQI